MFKNKVTKAAVLAALSAGGYAAYPYLVQAAQAFTEAVVRFFL